MLLYPLPPLPLQSHILNIRYHVVLRPNFSPMGVQVSYIFWSSSNCQSIFENVMKSMAKRKSKTSVVHTRVLSKGTNTYYKKLMRWNIDAGYNRTHGWHATGQGLIYLLFSAVLLPLHYETADDGRSSVFVYLGSRGAIKW